MDLEERDQSLEKGDNENRSDMEELDVSKHRKQLIPRNGFVPKYVGQPHDPRSLFLDPSSSLSTSIFVLPTTPNGIGVDPPPFPLPWSGEVVIGWCHALRLSFGLHTQCTSRPNKPYRYCRHCLIQAENSPTGKPRFGNVDDRLKAPILKYKCPVTGRLTLPYLALMKHMSLSRESVSRESQKIGMEIPFCHFGINESGKVAVYLKDLNLYDEGSSDDSDSGEMCDQSAATREHDFYRQSQSDDLDYSDNFLSTHEDFRQSNNLTKRKDVSKSNQHQQCLPGQVNKVLNPEAAKIDRNAARLEREKRREEMKEEYFAKVMEKRVEEASSDDDVDDGGDGDGDEGDDEGDVGDNDGGKRKVTEVDAKETDDDVETIDSEGGLDKADGSTVRSSSTTTRGKPRNAKRSKGDDNNVTEKSEIAEKKQIAQEEQGKPYIDNHSVDEIESSSPQFSTSQQEKSCGKRKMHLTDFTDNSNKIVDDSKKSKKSTKIKASTSSDPPQVIQVDNQPPGMSLTQNEFEFVRDISGIPTEILSNGPDGPAILKLNPRAALFKPTRTKLLLPGGFWVMKPSGYISGYNFFQRVRRPCLIVEAATRKISMNNNDINVLMGIQWRNISTSDKKPFELLSNADKLRYHKEVDAMNKELEKAGISESIIPAINKPKLDGDLIEARGSSGDMNKMRRPLTAYSFFCKHKTLALPNHGEGQLAMRRTAIEWKSMSEDEKSPYAELAKADKMRHLTIGAEYNDVRKTSLFQLKSLMNTFPELARQFKEANARKEASKVDPKIGSKVTAIGDFIQLPIPQNSVGLNSSISTTIEQPLSTIARGTEREKKEP